MAKRQGSGTVGEEAEIANADEAFGQQSQGGSVQVGFGEMQGYGASLALQSPRESFVDRTSR